MALTLMVMFVFTSCGKEQNNELSEEIDLSPRTENNIMIFKDVYQFQSYFEEMDKLYDEDDQAYGAIIESLDELNSVYKKIGDDIFINPEERYQPFLDDPIMMGLVNEYFEFQIENDLFTCVSNEYILVSDITDDALRNKIRSLEKGARFDINTIPENSYLITDDNFTNLIGPWNSKVEYISPVLKTASITQCKRDGKTKWDWDENFEHALSTQLKAYKSWGYTKEEAKVYNYRKVNGNWINENGQISARVDAFRQNEDCNYVNDENEYKECNCRNRSARVSTPGNRYHQTGDVIGSYNKVVNGQGVVWASHIIVF